MPATRSVLLLLALSASPAMRGADAPPDLPDPIGLGPRLVLLDHLRTKFGLKPSEDSTYEQLVALYWQEQHKREPQAPEKLDDSVMVDDDAMVRDRVNRLRAALRQEFKVEAAADASEADLAAQLRRLRDQRQQQAVEATARSSDRERVAATVEAEAASEAKVEKDGKHAAKGEAAGETKDAVGQWRARIHEAWKAIEAIPADVPTAWPMVDAPMANQSNRIRVRRNGGPFEYPDEWPKNEPGTEVWMQNTRIEVGRGGFGGSQTSRWYPAIWIAEDEHWTIEHPARYRWARESEHYVALIRLLIYGPSYDEARLKQWLEKRKALADAHGDPLGDADFVALCGAAAKEGGFADTLARAEADALMIETEFVQLDQGIKQFEMAQDLAREDAADQPKAAAWSAALEKRSQTLLRLHTDRRQILGAIVGALPK